MQQRSPTTIGLLLLLTLLCAANETAADAFAAARQAMVREIEGDVRSTSSYIGKAQLEPGVMAAMATVPRHRFVPRRALSLAYHNRALPIGHGQTISQPYIVALMTDLLAIDRQDQVLEVGTGSGYQAAILAKLAASVITMEIIAPLAAQARERLQELRYENVEVHTGDGYYGWPEKGPYDAIIVTAAASHVPPPLIKQLKKGGRMVIPVGSGFVVQQLLLIEKAHSGTITARQVLPVLFVPLTGEH